MPYFPMVTSFTFLMYDIIWYVKQISISDLNQFPFFLFQIYSALNKCSTMELYKSFIVLFTILSTSYAFELVTVEPKATVIPYGGKLRLTCNADGHYEWCKFMHNDKICDFQWKRDVWNITTLECSDFEGRSRFVGTYDNYECGMELDNVTPEGILLNPF